ncbi:MAG: Mut7-C RNAse domain-containing protein [Chloroflexi bacterium]|nr:Mut7-C RNAse domain-containing protein [Chloroflexota bacterium]MCL5025103.1 Mut7-C RNAse domain-containing protein [Chloroflexota bacterium]
MSEITPAAGPDDAAKAMPPCFVVDQMLGQLAKWLRLLGYDTIYSTSLDDADLARLAVAENRVLLTRDTQLARRRGVRALLVSSDSPPEQLKQVTTELDLLPADALSRCLRCNAPLQSIDRSVVCGLVPPYVWRTQEHFSVCPVCGRLYWRGTHWQRMQETLRHLRSEGLAQR